MYVYLGPQFLENLEKLGDQMLWLKNWRIDNLNSVSCSRGFRISKQVSIPVWWNIQYWFLVIPFSLVYLRFNPKFTIGESWFLQQSYFLSFLSIPLVKKSWIMKRERRVHFGTICDFPNIHYIEIKTTNLYINIFYVIYIMILYVGFSRILAE